MLGRETSTVASGRRPPSQTLPALLCFAWLCFVVYGSLLPFDFQAMGLRTALARFAETPWLDLGVEQRADWMANGLLFFPAGLLAAAWRGQRLASLSMAVLWILLVLGATLLEFVQLWFPARTVSLNDLVAESLGAGLGVLTYRCSRTRLTRLAHTIGANSERWFGICLRLYALAYVAFLLLPFDFVLSSAELRWKLAQLAHPWWPAYEGAGTLLMLVRLALDGLLAIPIGLLLGRSHRGPRAWSSALIVLAAALAAGLELLQFLLASGHAHLSAALLRCSGILLGLRLRSLGSQQVGLALRRWQHPGRSAGMLILIVVVLAGIDAGQGRGDWVGLEGVKLRLAEVRWLPFYYHYYTSEPVALSNLGLTLALYGSLGGLGALAAWRRSQLHGGSSGAWVAAGLALLLGAVLEGQKLFYVSGHPDPTTLLLAPLATYLAFTTTESACRHWVQQASEGTLAEWLEGRPRLWLITLAASAGWLLALSVQPPQADPHWTLGPVSNDLPLPALLPSQVVPGFRYQRPRLPAPETDDLQSLDVEWLDYRRQGALQGKLDDLILMARLEPGAWPLQPLLDQLLALKPSYRGHEQAKPLALAYDWLYEQWTSAERQRLHDHALGACAYTADQIRNDLLSPYNVFVYNSPLQALVACSIVLYRDSPHGTALFNFTRHYLEERMLPVWQQVMQDGGWHEGGEYVALGIGQAVYQIPAMWRRATGADWFREFPGLAGFADFLAYRTQPDGLQIRMGDGNHHDAPAPDRLALAIETQRWATYALGGCPRTGRPSSWPWGPLTDDHYCRPDAFASLPSFRLFRGLGLLVSRTDWDEQATYVTFKAGDNFWSHTHLDQGGFTIFKGGPLALDSGVYGRPYGNDHHMNYFYQSVAHNVVTVTDPADNTPQMLKGGVPKRYANDGGQRRVGSGWGLGAAPVDRRVWEVARDTYHTGELLTVYDQDELSIAVADLTAAYTNSRSGLDRFADRTRRVERYWRVFAHDRVEDVILVFDRLKVSNEDFTVRWLYHSGSQPEHRANGFHVSVPPRDRPGRQGGGLAAEVLLPEAAHIDYIGGRGREFWVDGKNYDEGGQLTAALQETGFDDAGAWRTEILAPPGREAEFLVALLPHALGVSPRAQVRALREADRYGCEILGSLRHTRWWWRANSPIPQVEQANDAGRWRALPVGGAP